MKQGEKIRGRTKNILIQKLCITIAVYSECDSERRKFFMQNPVSMRELGKLTSSLMFIFFDVYLKYRC